MTEAARNIVPLGAAKPPARTRLNGVELLLLAEGALFWPDEATLVVADLHLEKGSALAARGHLLPPYDSAASLAALARVVARHRPRRIVSLGDAFHDDGGPRRLNAPDVEALRALQTGCQWIWIAGNHDPAPPDGLEGICARELAVGPLTFRHQPAPGEADGELAGHLHPAGKVRVRGRMLRRRCFASDGARMILPAFGAYTGGLNVLDAAFDGLFRKPFHAWMLGEGRVHPIARAGLLPD